MNVEKKYTVLGKAEAYREEIDRSSGGAPPKLHRTFDEARAALLPQVKNLRSEIAMMRAESRLDEVVAEIRLDYQWLAKSYHPYTFIKQLELTLRGTGTWHQQANTSPKLANATNKPKVDVVGSRSLFLSGDETGFEALEKVLAIGTKNPSLQKDIIKIHEIRLPKAFDRLLVPADQAGVDPVPVEVVLFGWDQRRGDVSVQRVLSLVENGKEGHDFLIKRYQDGPTFIAIRVARNQLPALGEMNFLRVARSLPRMLPIRGAVPSLAPVPAAPPGTFRPTHKIAVFDGGIEEPHPHLINYVEHTDLTTKPAVEDLVAHGTAVCGAALYGSIDPSQTLSVPVCGILSYRVLPDSRSDAFELYGVIDALEMQVPKLPKDVRVVNLSLGPPGAIDATPSRFTYAIDRLSYNHDKLFFVAVGNTGDKPGHERVLAPADSVNNIGVGAFTFDPGKTSATIADYSCTGPGRPGGQVKPDILAFGGCMKVPFNVLHPKVSAVYGSWGTSLATPVASALAGELFARAPRSLSTQAARALMIHASERRGRKWKNHGWGLLPDTVEEILACTANKVSVLFQGTVSPKKSWKLPFLVPPGFDPNGEIKLSWTIVLTPEVDSSAIDEYTLAGLEHQLRPHRYRYTFSPPKGSPKTVKPLVVDIRTDPTVASDLLAKGWTQSTNPTSASTKSKPHESVLRKEEAKWDTIVKGKKSVAGVGLEEPCITISVLGRGEWESERPELLSARYAAVLTAEAPTYAGDLYSEVITNFKLLTPLQLRGRQEVLVRFGA